MKHTLRICVTTVVCAFSLTSTAFAASDSSISSTASGEAVIDGVQIPQAMLLQQEALNAYQVLYDSFDMDENHNYILPDNYAGEYIDDNYNLVIQLTTDDYSEYQTLLADFDCVEFITVDHSYNELKELADDTLQSFTETKISENIQYISSRVSVQDNKAVIKIATENPVEQDFKTFSAESVPLDIEWVHVEPKTEEVSSYQSAENPTAASGAVSLIGGDMISSPSGKSTISICGTYNGKSAFLMSGHSVGSHNRLYYEGNLFNDSYLIGSCVVRRFDNNNYGDYAVVTINTEGNFTATNKVKYKINSVPITATSLTVPSGTSVFSYGMSAGYKRFDVVSKGISIYYKEQDTTIKGLTSVYFEEGVIKDGDSGGPVYYYDNGEWTFCGNISGYDKNNPYGYVTPYQYMFSIFDVL